MTLDGDLRCRFSRTRPTRVALRDGRAGVKCELRLGDSKEATSVRPLGASARAVLEALPREPGSAYVLPSIRGGLRYGGHARALDRAAKASGIDGLTAHLLRHSFGSTAADLGYNESSIRSMLGHARHTVTSLYIHHLD